MCMTSFTPPLAKFYFAMVRGLVSKHSKRPCLAVGTSKLFMSQSLIVFVTYRKVFTYAIVLNLSAIFTLNSYYKSIM